MVLRQSDSEGAGIADAERKQDACGVSALWGDATSS